MAYLDLLNALARVVGGTQPDAAHSSVTAALQPYWYSGLETGDATGVPGIAGCFSVPTELITATPVGMVLQGPWAPDAALGMSGPRQGHRFTTDTIHVRTMVGHDAEADLMARLANFRDLVPAAFDAHMQLFGQPNVSSAWCETGDFIEVEWAGNVYFALVFMISVQRALPVTYIG
jgi:hypothetical protein